MIISVSRRTDIPAFYTEWFMNRISEGYVLLRNPFNAHQVRRVSLRPEDVDLIVFWTRNPEKLMPFLPSLESLGYRYYFQYTVTAYPRSIEKSVPSTQRAIQTFIALSELIGPRKVIWRYDPILISNVSSVEEHKRVFKKIAQNLAGYTQDVVISFVDIYKRVSTNLNRVPDLAVERTFEESSALFELAAYLSDVARQYGMSVQSCAEAINLEPYGVKHGKCIDDQLIRSLYPIEVSAKKDKSQRVPCGCVESIDIGQYDTCLHGCQYCYATTNQPLAIRNFEKHNPLSPFLIGEGDHLPLTGSENEVPKQESLF